MNKTGFIFTDTNILSDEEQLRLLNLYQEEGNTDARNKLATSYQKLVVDIVQKTANSLKDIDKAQLELDALNAVLKALEKFDISKENRISTFVYTYIQGFVMNSTYDSNHISQTYREFKKKKDEIESEYRQTHFKNPTDIETYELYKEKYNPELTFNEYMALLNGKPHIDSLDEPIDIDSDNDKTLNDFIPDNSYSPVEYSKQVFYEKALNELYNNYQGRDLQIMKLYFEEKLKQVEIARTVGLTKQTINEKVHKAEYLLNKILKDSNK